MKVARDAGELERAARAVAVGAFDGVHLGHRSVVRALAAAGGVATVVAFDPHPHAARLVTTLERRLELLAETGVEEALVAPPPSTDDELAELLTPLAPAVVVGGDGTRLDALAQRAFEVVRVPVAPFASTEAIRRLVAAGDVARAAQLLGRPVEVDGVVVGGDARGKALGYPTANVEPAAESIVPARGIYAGAALGHRAAISIGVNPHYGGTKLRVEAFLLDFEGDLYGTRLVIELWRYLRPEQVFANEGALVAAIARDVEDARRAERPA